MTIRLVMIALAAPLAACTGTPPGSQNREPTPTQPPQAPPTLAVFAHGGEPWALRNGVLERLLDPPRVFDVVNFIEVGRGTVAFCGLGADSRQVYVTDGTPAGTVRLAEGLRGSDSCEAPRAWGGRLYFALSDATHGEEPWVSDGTTSGTHLLLDVAPGAPSSSPLGFTGWGERVYFSATEALHGRELWVTDGSGDGTRLFEDLVPGTVDSSPSNLTPLGSSMLFTAGVTVVILGQLQDLWRTDGTASGTHPYAGRFQGADHFTVVGAWVYFAASGDIARWVTLRLWRTNGVTSERVSLAIPERAFAVGDRLVFLGYELATQYQLWASDGTPDGTAIVKSFVPGLDRDGALLTLRGGKVWFPAVDDTRGSELWMSDGTEAGTLLVSDALRGAAGFIEPLDSVGVVLTPTDGLLFIGGSKVWISDGTAAGTYPIATLP